QSPRSPHAALPILLTVRDPAVHLAATKPQEPRLPHLFQPIAGTAPTAEPTAHTDEISVCPPHNEHRQRKIPLQTARVRSTPTLLPWRHDRELAKPGTRPWVLLPGP